jgi:hypothetical protein
VWNDRPCATLTGFDTDNVEVNISRGIVKLMSARHVCNSEIRFVDKYLLIWRRCAWLS